MREIKFRMWDKQGNKMYDVDEISLEKRWARMKYYSNYTVSTLSFNDIELMQFTGLYDKNGKEIYENMEIDNKYIVLFHNCKYILKDMSNNNIIDLWRYVNENKCEITREYIKI